MFAAPESVPRNAGAQALCVIAHGFHALRQPVETRASRRKRLKRYGEAITSLRLCVAGQGQNDGVLAAIFAFCLYEARHHLYEELQVKSTNLRQMTVSSDTQDKTWRVHLDAFITLDQKRRLAKQMNAAADRSTTLMVQSSPHDGALLLRAATYELRSLAQAAETLFAGQSLPRKLDVRKVYAALLKICRNLRLLSSSRSTPGNDQELKSWALSLTSLNMLVQSAAFLDGTSEAKYLASHAAIRRQLRNAIERTCSEGRREAEAIRAPRLSSRTPDQHSFANALGATWSLCSVLASPAATPCDQADATETLTTIGELACIPRALGMVCLRQACKCRHRANTSCRCHPTRRLVQLSVRSTFFPDFLSWT